MNTTKPISLRNKLCALPRTIFAYFMGLLIVLFLFLPTLVIAAIPQKYRPERLLFWFLRVIYKSILVSLLLPIRIVGKENLPVEPAIFVANHESSLDIPLLGVLMRGYPHLWYVFAIFAYKPIFGFLVRRIGVPVDQQGTDVDVRALVAGIRRVANKKVHTLIFPEGGRFIDGKIHKFYQGFGLIAKKTGRPIIPVLIHNAGKVYPPKSFFIYKFPLTLVIGPAFYYKEGEAPEQLRNRIHDWFVLTNEYARN